MYRPYDAARGTFKDGKLTQEMTLS